jgi:hypothetical protein
MCSAAGSLRAASCAERPPAWHHAHQTFLSEHTQRPRDRGLADVVVLSQRGHGGKRFAWLPFARADPPPQVTRDDLVRTLGTAWHIVDRSRW